ncbi:MAG: hypothetical protein IJ867_01680 [Clostridia bacterium]|nr:hypothetical protein [Clostridia bacterium]
MLILAGVSLNAIIGDNGIITNAQNAKIESGMAALEEWLQEKYVEYYDEVDNYASKVDLLNAKIPNLLFQNGIKNYFVYENKVYYLINKAALPEEIRKGLSGGDSNELVALKSLYDVYGLNLDLTVYYIDKIEGITYGDVNVSSLDKNQKAQQVISGDSGVRLFVEEALESLGVEIDPELGITIGNVISIQQLTLDGSVHSINSLAGIADLTSLKKLILKDLNITDLNGLENCIFLEYLYFDNCTISNITNGYASLASLVKLKTLYMHLPGTILEADANNQVLGLSNGLHNAKYITELETFGIFGEKSVFNWFSGSGWSYTYNPIGQNSREKPFDFKF